MVSIRQDCIEDEDEDVILQGSELHAVLTEMGFKDFECAPVERTGFPDPELLHYNQGTKACSKISERIYNTTCNFFRCVMQDNQHLDEQLKIILRLDCLLDDHVAKIESFISGRKQSLWKNVLHWLPLVGSSLSIAVCGFNEEYKNIYKLVLASSVLSISVRRQFLQWNDSKILRYLISHQNQFYHSCKKTLQILRYSFRMRLDANKSSQKFIELEKSKQMYLPLLTEILISSLERVSVMYNRTSSAILKLLPSTFSIEDLITSFETDSFHVKGEVTYKTLKNIYYTYLLVQSEMLYILAIAYNPDTWQNASVCPEMELSHIINNLVKIVEKHSSRILKLLNEYFSKKFIPERREYKGSKSSKWQDLYVHLDLTAYRLQMAYKVLLSTLEEIDSQTELNSSDNFSESIMQNLNEVYKQIEIARNFTEFSTLLIAKVQHNQSKKHDFKESKSINQESITEGPVVIDTEPQIVDEVFEEYIKEEYLKPLYEDGDNLAVQNYKFDKLLAKNFMSELKDALIEKHKSMSERESKALQRMYRTVTQEVVSKQGNDTSSEIKSKISPPFPSPMPAFNISASSNSEDKLIYKESKKFYQVPNYVKSVDINQQINFNNEDDLKSSRKVREDKQISDKLSVPNLYQNHEKNDDEQVDVQRFPITKCTPNLQFPPFLKVMEETFTGSGENSEDELENNESEGGES